MPDLYLLLLSLAPVAFLGGVWLIFRSHYPRQIWRLIRPDTAPVIQESRPPRDAATATSQQPIDIDLMDDTGLAHPSGTAASDLASRARAGHHRMVAGIAAAVGAFAILRAIAFTVVWSEGGADLGRALAEFGNAASLLFAPTTIFLMAVLPAGRLRIVVTVFVLGLGFTAALGWPGFGNLIAVQIYFSVFVLVLVSRAIRPLAVIVLAALLAAGLFLYPGAGLVIQGPLGAFGLQNAFDRAIEAWLTSLWPSAPALAPIYAWLMLAMLVPTSIVAWIVGGRRLPRGEVAFYAVLIALGVSLVLLGPSDTWLPLFLAMVSTTAGFGAIIFTVGAFLRLSRRGHLPNLIAQIHLAVAAVAGLDGFALSALIRVAESAPTSEVTPFFVAGVCVLGYLVTLHVTLSITARSAGGSAHQLLLLRTFGNPGNAHELLALLEDRWRHIGRVDLIAAGDIADVAMRHDSIFFSVRERMAAQLISLETLEARLQRIDTRVGLDLRFPVNGFLCAPNAWQTAIERLLPKAEVVLMDLRGFTYGNEGCAFELRLLIDQFPLHHAVLIVDATTDPGALQATLVESGAARPAQTGHTPVHPRRRIAAVDFSHGRRADQLNAALFRAAGETGR
ncbi:MAG: hypothetical protein LJE97_09075 [Betaproteobacteria bacterium]|jgi:hypothetical protein|nr:hypothetical protein [Betaproteobacteria bacterium]